MQTAVARVAENQEIVDRGDIWNAQRTAESKSETQEETEIRRGIDSQPTAAARQCESLIFLTFK